MASVTGAPPGTADGSSVGCTSRSASRGERTGIRAAGEIERHERSRAVGAWTVDGVLHREVRAAAVRPAVPPQGPAEGDGLGEAVVEGRREAQHAATVADEVEARDVAGEQRGVATVLGQAEPGAQEHPRDRGAEPGQQHERVAQGP